MSLDTKDQPNLIDDLDIDALNIVEEENDRHLLNALLSSDRACYLLCAVNTACYAVAVCLLYWLTRLLTTFPGQYTSEFIDGYRIAVLVWLLMTLMLLMYFIFATPSKKQRLSFAVFCIYILCTVTYTIQAMQLLPSYKDRFGHEFHPVRYVEWMCTTVLMLLLICNLDKQDIAMLQHVVINDMLMIIAGFFASIASSFSLMVLLLTLSFYCEYQTIIKIHWMCVHYREQVLQFPRISRSMSFLEFWLLLTYASIPIVWLLHASELIDDYESSLAYCVCETVGKQIYTAILLIVNFDVLDQHDQLKMIKKQASYKIELQKERAQLASVKEQLRHEAEIRLMNETNNENRKYFIRYFLHEMRVPLNTVVLILEDRSTESLHKRIHSETDFASIVSPSLRVSLSPYSTLSRRISTANLQTLEETSPSSASDDFANSTINTSSTSHTSIGDGSEETNTNGSDNSEEATRSSAVDGSVSLSQEELRAIRMAIQHMVRLFDQIVSLQRIDDNEIVLDSQALSLQMICLETTSIVQPLFDRRGLKLRLELDESIPYVYGDSDRLKQVMLTFLSNAFRFSLPEDHRAVKSSRNEVVVQLKRCRAGPSTNTTVIEDMSATDKDEIEEGENSGGNNKIDNKLGYDYSDPLHPRVNVRMSVRDFGIGLMVDDLQRIFVPFRQLTSGESSKGKATGLGLSICKRLLDMMNGKIGVYTNQLRGSRFFMELPFEISVDSSPTPLLSTTSTMIDNTKRATAEFDIASETESEGDASRNSMASSRSCSSRTSISSTSALLPEPPSFIPSDRLYRPKRILVVDDAASNRRLLARLVTKAFQCQTDLAEDGLEAVDMVIRNVNKYDLILMDYEMPRMNGGLCVQKLREIGVRCPIIGVTANALQSDVQHFMSCGLDGITTKPVNMTQLSIMVQDLLRKIKLSI